MTFVSIRVMCVDDHRIVREGLRFVLGRQPDMTVVASASTGEEAVQLYDQYRPDVILMDLQLGRVSGVEAIERIVHIDPTARIVVLTMFQGDEDIYRALAAGATTYLLKDTSMEDLVGAIRQVHAGDRPLVPEVRTRLEARAAQPRLTPREIQVVALISRGLKNREIGVALGISEDTAHVHVRNIFSKLKVNDRGEAITVALRRGIIHLEESGQR